MGRADSADVAAYFSSLRENPTAVATLEDLLGFTKADPREQYPAVDVRRWERCLDPSVPVKGSAAYQRLLDADRYAGSDATILGALEAHACDALVLPSRPTDLAASPASLAG